ncbi:Dps family protein, partial [Enterococcus faecalis]
DEGDDALEDTLIAFKNDLDKNIWMLQAFIGKEALEDDDALDEDED